METTWGHCEGFSSNVRYTWFKESHFTTGVYRHWEIFCTLFGDEKDAVPRRPKLCAVAISTKIIVAAT